jgi:O-acetylhomoserine/O-acetylserine sulfhydrylase-like pyridoxal-dependent enzyme
MPRTGHEPDWPVSISRRGQPVQPGLPQVTEVEATLSHPATTSHRGRDESQLAAQGMTAGMVRISVGLEDIEDLWSEFSQGLDGVSR